MSVLELIYLFWGLPSGCFIYTYIYIYIAMENDPFIDELWYMRLYLFKTVMSQFANQKNNQRVLSKFMCYMLYTIYILFYIYIYIYASYVSCRWVTRWLPTKLVRPSSGVTKSLAPRCAASWRESAQNPRSSPWKKGGGPIHGGIPWVWVKIRYPNNWMVHTKLD